MGDLFERRRVDGSRQLCGGHGQEAGSLARGASGHVPGCYPYAEEPPLHQFPQRTVNTAVWRVRLSSPALLKRGRSSDPFTVTFCRRCTDRAWLDPFGHAPLAAMSIIEPGTTFPGPQLKGPARLEHSGFHGYRESLESEASRSDNAVLRGAKNKRWTVPA
ncbi:hypothetical protein AAFF_G00424790 [Aldrovandia affinis]|uniref:Uncharacterized protein n=1 Tax=Aldrovandia affinis TaxID=143900 RepID=A0AAD7X120_9TELE|nr:hypothetical protein AAFF_G00424790 [Aldrovandia affinis]